MSTNKKKILVVDDDLTIRTMILDILSEAGYIVDAAENGKKALRLLDNNIYDLTISDVHMPEMDGISLFRKATEDLPELKRKFLFLTGKLIGEVQSFFKINNLEYMTKPFQIPALLDKITSMTKKDISLKGRSGMYWRREERFSASMYCGVNAQNISNLIAKTQNISQNGAKIRHIGEPFSPGAKISIYIMNLNLRRDAEVIWTKPVGSGEHLTGLHFTAPIQMPKGFIFGI